MSASAAAFDIDDRKGVRDVRRGRLDYFSGERVAVGERVGCRVTRQQVPGLELAALCLAPGDG